MISINRILVPTDFSEHGLSALNYAATFADEFSASVDLFHVIEPIPVGATLTHGIGARVQDEIRKAAEQQMEALNGEWQKHSFSVRRSVVEGHPFVEIVRKARECEADVIVMGTHGRGAVTHMLLGSVAERVVREAPCPVLTVRHPDHELLDI